MDPKKLKTLSDFSVLQAPISIDKLPPLDKPLEDIRILRMLVKPKYSSYRYIPRSLGWLGFAIARAHMVDYEQTGIKDEHKWCYVTVRNGINPEPDNSFHFDGGSLRTELIPERNYVYNHTHPLLYKMGKVDWPGDFDPIKQNMFSHVEKQEGLTVHQANQGWNLLYPNVFHARLPGDENRLFVRITFTDIEIRDVMCTQNPELGTEAYGRDPRKSFRDSLSM